MSDDLGPKQPAAIYEPGELDQTRKNIGALDEEEARKMTKVLGGQIFTEKSAPDIASIENDTPKSSSGQKKETAAANKPHKANKHNQDDLPQISSRVRQMIDRLMMGDDYKIKPNYGLFNFIRYLKKNGTEKVNKEFAEYTVKNHVDHMQIFITSIKTLIQISPDTYKGKIASDEEARFRFLRTVGGWTMRDIKVLALDIQENSDDMTVSQLVPFVG